MEFYLRFRIREAKDGWYILVAGSCYGPFPDRDVAEEIAQHMVKLLNQKLGLGLEMRARIERVDKELLS